MTSSTILLELKMLYSDKLLQIIILYEGFAEIVFTSLKMIIIHPPFFL
jgi:hypothetical protein